MDLKKLLSGRDNETPDIARHSWMWSMIAVFAGEAWNAIHATSLDLMQFASAIGAVVAAHGAAIWAKKDTEPEAGDK
jgi:hypothetical protein